MNKYLAYGKEIRDISVNQGVDVGVAFDMFCQKQGIKYFPHDAEQKEFLDMCRKYTLDKIIQTLKDI